MNVVEREFDAVAAEYESNRLASWYKAHAEEILAYCPPLEQGNILDVGCGSGYLLRAYLRRHPGARGIGLDISPAMIDQAERLARNEDIDAQFIRADWESFDTGSLRDRDIGLAVCANAFHYFSNPARAAEKLWDVLNEGGVLLVLERDKSKSMLTFLWGWLHRHCIKDNVEFYTQSDLLSFFNRAGFEDVDVVKSINRLLWKNKLYTSVALIRCLK